MFIPGLSKLMLDTYRYCKGWERPSWRERAVVTPTYPLFVITNSIDTAFLTLRGEVDEKNIQLTKELKLIEIIGE